MLYKESRLARVRIAIRQNNVIGIQIVIHGIHQHFGLQAFLLGRDGASPYMASCQPVRTASYHFKAYCIIHNDAIHEMTVSAVGMDATVGRQPWHRTLKIQILRDQFKGPGARAILNEQSIFLAISEGDVAQRKMLKAV